MQCEDGTEYLSGDPQLSQGAPQALVGTCPARGGTRQGSTSALRPNPLPEFQQRVHATYSHFRGLKEGHLKRSNLWHEMPTGGHWQPPALLQDKIKRLSLSISSSHQWSGSCRWLDSHWKIWSRATDWCSREPQVSSCNGEHISRRAQSPSLLHSRW